MATYRIVGHEFGDPELPAFDPYRHMNYGDLFTDSLSEATEALLTDAGLIQRITETYQIIAPQPAIGLAATVALINRRYSARFVPDEDMIAAGIAWEVTSFATNDDPCDVGLFSADGAVLLASSGAVSGKMNTSNGIKYQAFTATIPVTAGIAYYAALSYGAVGGTAATIRMTSSGGVIDDLFGTAVGKKAQGLQTSGHPLAAPLTQAVVANVPYLAVRSA
jgi:hypothetical protein